MKNFFNPENFLWQWFAHLADYFLLSCLWVICSIPVFTIGAASIALYDTVAHCVRGKDQAMFRRFFRTLKAELGRGAVLTLLWAAAAALLNGIYQVITQMAGGNTFLNLLSISYFILMLIPLGIGCWAIAIESRFTHSLASLHRTALAFTFVHLPHTLAIVALFVVTLNLLRSIPFLVMFLPGMMVTFQSWFIEKVFRKYIPEETHT
jgi:uncharacterized membrane protein YesL